MAGRAGALDDLTRVAGSTDESLDVRQESIRSIGEIGTDAAREVLTQTATAPGDLALRKSAIQELGRTFGDAALPALEALLQDEDEAVRNNAVKAISRMDSPAATALLQSAASSDMSPTVRMQAEAALASRGTNSGSSVN
jgi:HEAT repeat protein